MLVDPDLLERFWDIHPNSILHVGAHDGEEREWYHALSWGEDGIVWVEALPEKAANLRKLLSDSPREVVLEMVAWSSSGVEVSFNRTNNSQSSSALTLVEHLVEYPGVEVVESISMVSSVLESDPLVLSLPSLDMVNLDVQGAEIHVLIGLGKLLERVTAIYSEFSTRELYAGGARLGDLDAYLGKSGFIRVDRTFTCHGWGDALWIRREVVPPLAFVRRWRRRLVTLRRNTCRRICKLRGFLLST